MITPESIFRVTSYEPEITHLLSFLDHFKTVQIPSGLISSDNGYSVWRVGTDAIQDIEEEPIPIGACIFDQYKFKIIWGTYQWDLHQIGKGTRGKEPPC